MPINVLLVFGAGSNRLWGQGITKLREKIINEFSDDVFVPPAIDHTQSISLTRLLGQWDDPTILIGHSCGVRAITKATIAHPMKSIPYLMGIATSVFCQPGAVGPNVKKISEVIANSNGFNLRERPLIKRKAGNNITEIEKIHSRANHVKSAEVDITHNKAIHEIRRVIAYYPPDFLGV